MDLMPGEHLVLASNPHWWFFWKEVLGGVGVVIVFLLSIWTGGALSTFFRWVAVAGLVAWVAETAYQYAQWRTTSFTITDRRVAYQSGLFRRRGVSIPLDRVNNVNFEQSFIARLLDNGVVIIESAGQGDSVFENIPQPDGVRRQIFEQMDAMGRSGDERTAAAMAAAMQANDGQSPKVPSVAERLAELDKLRSEGIISDAEYDQKRADILGSL